MFARPALSALQSTAASPVATASRLPTLTASATRGIRAIPIKRQLTPTSMWSRRVDSNPETIDPSVLVPPRVLERMAIPFSKTADGPLPATPLPRAPASADAAKQRRLKKTVLSMRRTVKVTKGGKVVSMSAMVVVGDGNGTVGYGEGKDADAARAVKKAEALAIKNMIAIDRYDERTVLHDLAHEFKATRVEMRAAPPGFGLRTNPNVHEICRCAGIQDLSAKVMGSRNPINVVKATFQALQSQKTADDLARGRGMRVHDVRKLVYGQ
ncbi:28S ribosomal protein S5, mitochondrial [Allomyces arbusculus]|nr:28S ribosomal protein S5, mitochondrial [Allomyces arbusculus]